MYKGLPDRGREKSQGRLNHLQQQVKDGNVLSHIILISFRNITTYEHLSLFLGRAISLNFLLQKWVYLIIHGESNFTIYTLEPII